MAIYEILNDKGEVENRIVADEEFVEEVYPGKYRLVDEPQAPPPIASVTRLQAKVALMNAGLLDSVEEAIANADPLVKLAWAEAMTFERNSPALLAIAEDLAMSSSDLDDLFAAAREVSI
jgi:hypothetical protein